MDVSGIEVFSKDVTILLIKSSLNSLRLNRTENSAVERPVV
jgi:hypothetical protein